MKKKPRGRFAKFLAFGITDTLFAPAPHRFVVLDLAVIFASFQWASWYSPYGQVGVWRQPYVITGLIFAFGFALCALGLGFYDKSNRHNYLSVARISLIAALIAAATAMSSVYFIFYDSFGRDGRIGRLTMLYGMAGGYFAVMWAHLVLAWLLRRNRYRFTIVGDSPQLTEIRHFCESGRKSTQMYVHVPWETLCEGQSWPTIDSLLEHRVGDVVVANDSVANQKVVEFALRCFQARLLVVDELAFYQQVFERIPVDAVDKTWILREGLSRRNIITAALKRWFDILISAVGVVVSFPILLLIALLIKASDGGPIFFNRMRQGRYTTPFRMYKFRTMRVADDRSKDHSFTKVGDQRITLIGKVLRPLHLDELPQLLNVLLGDMSIVGPRPEALEFAGRMRSAVPLYDLRYMIRPGITGYAQINQGYAMDSVADTKQKLSYDLYYLCRHTIWTDLQIILRTMFFLAKGAR